MISSQEAVTSYRGNILIVDDLPDNLRLLRDTLSAQGYKVRSATTGSMAIRAAQSPATELILLDVKLPDLDGYEVCKQLKSDEQTENIPIIFLSALNDTFNKVQGFAVGGVDYISKPFQVEEVLARVEIHLTIRRLRKSLQEQNINLAKEMEENKRLKEIYFAEKELAQVTLKSIGDAVITTDAECNIKYFNPVAESLTGWKSAEAEGLPLSEVFVIINETTRKPTENPIIKALAMGQIVGLANHTLLIARDGTEHSIEDSAAPIRNLQGKVIGAVIVFHDVTESRNLAKQISWDAGHDALTDLINRRGFEPLIVQAIASVANDERHILCYLDLDQFKVINDTVGHIAGDELLRQISTLLQNAVRINDKLARLGGDEFGLLLSQCPLSEAAHIAENIRDLVHQFRFVWNNKTFIIGVSIGVVAIDENSQDLKQVMGEADAACYAAKAKGRNCIHVYKPDDRDVIRQRGERQMIAKISHALETNSFCLYGQKIISILSQPSLEEHYEVLLRMFDEQGELISPSNFIPSAERYDLITEIDRWVINNFFSNYQNICKYQVCTGGLYTINISGSSIGNHQFLDFLIAQFSLYQIPPQNICFEITETAAIANFDQARHFISIFKEIGCRFALDDFGNGLSSFAYLMNLPIDYLKIDGSFVKNMSNDSVSQAIVKAFNDIAHAMNLRTIAEFVENEDILEEVRKIGIDYAQGYAIARPVPLEF